MSKTLKLFLEGLLVEHPLQLLNHPTAIRSFAVKKDEDKLNLKDKMIHHPNIKNIGGGVEAEVGAKKTERHEFEDPNHVYKVFHTIGKPENNATYSYLKHAAQEHNPYFPRIHSIKSYFHPAKNQHKSSSATHIVKMEKLHPLHTLNEPEHEHEYHALLKRIFHGKHGNSFTNSGFADNGIQGNTQRGNWDNLSKKIKDEHLINALKDIHGIAKLTKSNVDLHGGNIMLRRTQHGLHAVITDPVVR